jgi:tripartite ATP-independent transporter DctM subunit
MEWIALILFLSIFLTILTGYPVAFILGGLSYLIGVIYLGNDFFQILPMRFMGIMSNQVLMAVPLFIFMGIGLQKSKIAQIMLENMAALFGNFKGGMGISVIVVGGMLAASTGIVGATVVTMGLISMPVMLKNGYSPKFSSGIIAASGTLGQIIPPSIVLILLGSVMSISIGDLFYKAIMPGIMLIILYLVYVILVSYFNPSSFGTISKTGSKSIKEIIFSFILPFFLIALVLGSIYLGFASPTEAAAVGAFGSILLMVLIGDFSIQKIFDVSSETMLLTSMVFFTLLGATSFALVFRGLGGDDMIHQLITTLDLSAFHFVLALMLLVFLLGFIIDFIEIIFILIPVVLPILKIYDINLLWFGILLAINIQTSFLTPPFGFSLFYLKGVAPSQVKTSDIYKGSIPFLFIQLFILLMLLYFPQLFGLSIYN